MPGLSDYSELKTLDFLFGSTQPATPGTWYLGLLITAGAETILIQQPRSLLMAVYARLAIPNNTTRWSAAASGTKAKLGRFSLERSLLDLVLLIGWCYVTLLLLERFGFMVH